MQIAGLQKLTLIDYPGKLACTIFLFGCNFRCRFCHNPELVVKPNEIFFSEENILDFLKKRRKYLNAVCFTGGEPLMSLDLNFVKKIKSLGYLIKIDTNGSFPERLHEFVDAGLIDYVAMDIKSSKEKYSEVANADVNLDKIEKSINIISKLPDYEFRTTILKRYHSIDEMKKIMEWLVRIVGEKIKKFVLQGFKNNGKFIDPDFMNEKDVSEEYLLKLKEVVNNYCEKVEIRN